MVSFPPPRLNVIKLRRSCLEQKRQKQQSTRTLSCHAPPPLFSRRRCRGVLLPHRWPHPWIGPLNVDLSCCLRWVMATKCTYKIHPLNLQSKQMYKNNMTWVWWFTLVFFCQHSAMLQSSGAGKFKFIQSFEHLCYACPAAPVTEGRDIPESHSFLRGVTLICPLSIRRSCQFLSYNLRRRRRQRFILHCDMDDDWYTDYHVNWWQPEPLTAFEKWWTHWSLRNSTLFFSGAS